jgi:hypothetical protein
MSFPAPRFIGLFEAIHYICFGYSLDFDSFTAELPAVDGPLYFGEERTEAPASLVDLRHEAWEPLEYVLGQLVNFAASGEVTALGRPRAAGPDPHDGSAGVHQPIQRGVWLTAEPLLDRNSLAVGEHIVFDDVRFDREELKPFLQAPTMEAAPWWPKVKQTVEDWCRSEAAVEEARRRLSEKGIIKPIPTDLNKELHQMWAETGLPKGALRSIETYRTGLTAH